MGYALRSGLSFCIVDGHVIFLDLPADRYFQLTREAEDAFVHLYTSPAENPSDLAKVQLSRVLVSAPDINRLLGPVVPVPTGRSIAMDWEKPAPALALRALVAQFAMERILKRRGLAGAVDHLRRQKDRLRAGARTGSTFERWIEGFEQAKLLRSPVNRCLSRSMAMASCLFRAGFAVQLVMGVRLRPFAAHCWVQDGGSLLNDTPEEVATFTPVFVL